MASLNFPKMMNWYVKGKKPLVIGQNVELCYDKLIGETNIKWYRFTECRARYLGDLQFSLEKGGQWSPPYNLGEFRQDAFVAKWTKFIPATPEDRQAQQVWYQGTKAAWRELQKKRQEEEKQSKPNQTLHNKDLLD
jgi:hypothetical protein